MQIIPVGRLQGALHIAAIQTDPLVLQAHLLAKSNPYLPDMEGMLPVHHAMCVTTSNQARMLEILLENGSNVLARDKDGDTAFSLAPPGQCVRASMAHCWNKLTMMDLLFRHMSELVTYCWCPALWNTCKDLHRQCHFFPFDLRGASADVSFQSDNVCLAAV